MKVVINGCYGGFSLSDEAFELLLNKKNIKFEKVVDRIFTKYYKKGFVGSNEHYLSMYSYCKSRTDEDLISVIEELGERADGINAELKIIEIPDDVEFHIENYDGAEWVAENHRTWN